jgi:hypothetical protein
LTHAFLITAYKDEVQLCTLVTQLLKYPSCIYIHIDKKSPVLQKSIAGKYTGNERIKIIANPVSVYWGGFSHLKAILLLISEAFKDQANARFHLISGQDLPIRSTQEFHSFFHTHADKEYITSFQLPDPQWSNGGLDRIRYYHLNDVLDPKKYFFPRINGRFIRLQKWLGIKRKQPSYISAYYGGGTWWSISRNAVKEIVDFQKTHPGFIRGFKHTYCPEEIFFQTILNHSSIKENLMPEDLRYIDWNVAGGKFPPVLDESYLQRIFKTKKFFARKFDSEISENLRKRLEKAVDGKEIKNPVL